MSSGQVAKKDSVVGYLYAAGQTPSKNHKLSHVRGFGDLSSSNEEIEDSDFDDSSKTYSLGIADNGTFELTFNAIQGKFALYKSYKDLGTDLVYEHYVKDPVADTVILAVKLDCVVSKVDVTGQSLNGLIELKITLRLNNISEEEITEPTTGLSIVSAVATRTASGTASVVTSVTGGTTGSYYTALVDAGDTTPTIDTSGAGTSFSATPFTISVAAIADAAAKDLYIKVKDADGVSDFKKVVIPAFA